MQEEVRIYELKRESTFKRLLLKGQTLKIQRIIMKYIFLSLEVRRKKLEP